MLTIVSGAHLSSEAKEIGQRLRARAKEPIDPEDFVAMQRTQRATVARALAEREEIDLCPDE